MVQNIYNHSLENVAANDKDNSLIDNTDERRYLRLVKYIAESCDMSIPEVEFRIKQEKLYIKQTKPQKQQTINIKPSEEGKTSKTKEGKKLSASKYKYVVPQDLLDLDQDRNDTDLLEEGNIDTREYNKIDSVNFPNLPSFSLQDVSTPQAPFISPQRMSSQDAYEILQKSGDLPGSPKKIPQSLVGHLANYTLCKAAVGKVHTKLGENNTRCSAADYLSMLWDEGYDPASLLLETNRLGLSNQVHMENLYLHQAQNSASLAELAKEQDKKIDRLCILVDKLASTTSNLLKEVAVLKNTIKEMSKSGSPPTVEVVAPKPIFSTSERSQSSVSKLQNELKRPTRTPEQTTELRSPAGKTIDIRSIPCRKVNETLWQWKIRCVRSGVNKAIMEQLLADIKNEKWDNLEIPRTELEEAMELRPPPVTSIDISSVPNIRVHETLSEWSTRCISSGFDKSTMNRLISHLHVKELKRLKTAPEQTTKLRCPAATSTDHSSVPVLKVGETLLQWKHRCMSLGVDEATTSEIIANAKSKKSKDTPAYHMETQNKTDVPYVIEKSLTTEPSQAERRKVIPSEKITLIRALRVFLDTHETIFNEEITPNNFANLIEMLNNQIKARYLEASRSSVEEDGDRDDFSKEENGEKTCGTRACLILR